MKKRNYRLKSLIALSITLAINFIALSQNPIVPNKGLNDPHIHIFNDTAYVYASHDKSAANKSFIMEDWWVWSSPDLVNWTQSSVLKPADTYIGDGFTGCWATDVGYRNGKYYWYFSERNEQSGVAIGDSPVGPWKDALGKPLLAADLTPTHEYDMAIFEEGGQHYIIFGVWDYYISRLNDDMISLAEEPKKIIINNPRGPYNQDGTNTEKPTDDKPFVHKYNGKYYLSWGCFYAMSDDLYGPYDYTGSVINKDSFAKGYDAPTWPNGFLQGRHGSYFEWNNQWYYTYCDISQTGNRYFRDTFISYIHYKDNGEMATIRVDGIGVGQYDANQSIIEAEDYFKASGTVKKESKSGGFVLSDLNDGDYVIYPNINGLTGKSKIIFDLIGDERGSIEIRLDSPGGKLISTCEVLADNSGKQSKVTASISGLKAKQSICLVFKGKGNQLFQLDGFSFK